MKRLLPLFLLTAALLPAPPAAAQSSAPSLSGRVVDTNGRPLAGIPVRLLSGRVEICVTDSLGQYELTQPSEGVVTLEYAGYLPQTMNVFGERRIEFHLRPEPAAPRVGWVRRLFGPSRP